MAAWSAAALVCGALAWMVLDVVGHGLGAVSFSFLIEAPRDAGRAGGIGPVIVSTVWILAICLAVAVPIALGTAMLLAEFTRREHLFGRLVRRSLDVLAAVPSIVFGLFGNALFCRAMGMGFSILSGGLTLACMILPLLIRSTEAGFRTAPESHRHGAAALGLSRTTTVFRVLLPAAVPGLVVGLVLSVGRAMAETAALLFTSGYVDRFPGSVLDSGRTLSVHIYEMAMNVPGANANAYGTAVVLLGILLILNAAAAFLTRRWLGGKVVRT